MELKQPLELELIYRTYKNTQRIKMGDIPPSAKRYEKTQLLGSFFITIVLLKESNLYTFEDNICTYGITPTIELNEFNYPENTKGIIRHIRNALAHFKIDIKCIDEDNWQFTFTDYMEIDNNYRTKYQIHGKIIKLTPEQINVCQTIDSKIYFPHWRMTLSSNDIETFINSIFEKLHKKYTDKFPFPD